MADSRASRGGSPVIGCARVRCALIYWSRLLRRICFVTGSILKKAEEQHDQGHRNDDGEDRTRDGTLGQGRPQRDVGEDVEPILSIRSPLTASPSPDDPLPGYRCRRMSP